MSKMDSATRRMFAAAIGADPADVEANMAINEMAERADAVEDALDKLADVTRRHGKSIKSIKADLQAHKAGYAADRKEQQEVNTNHSRKISNLETGAVFLGICYFGEKAWNLAKESAAPMPPVPVQVVQND